MLIVDALLTGASAGAEHSGLATAAAAPNVNMLRTPRVPPMGSGLRRLDGRVGRMRDAALHRLNDVLMGTGTLNDTRREMGLDPGRLTRAERPAGGSGHLPDQRKWRHDGRQAVLLSLSTTFMRPEGLLQRLVDALGQVDCDALVTTGPGMRSRPMARVPSKVHVVESARTVLCCPHRPGDHPWRQRHGDPALAGGVPVMVVPISRDQLDNAARAVHHGVGIKVSKRSSPAKFAAAVPGTLADDAIRASAREMAERLTPDVGAPNVVAAPMRRSRSSGSDPRIRISESRISNRRSCGVVVPSADAVQHRTRLQE